MIAAPETRSIWATPNATALTRAKLSRYLIGWRGYFGICETPSVLRALDQWTRRRLRSIVWKQWKRGRTRFAELRRRGVGHDLAAQTAGSAHVPWRFSCSPGLHMRSPTPSSTKTLGLASVADAYRIINRTAVYGPVRTVVWEGRGREASPYPDWGSASLRVLGLQGCAFHGAGNLGAVENRCLSVSSRSRRWRFRSAPGSPRRRPCRKARRRRRRLRGGRGTRASSRRWGAGWRRGSGCRGEVFDPSGDTSGHTSGAEGRSGTSAISSSAPSKSDGSRRQKEAEE